MHLTCDTVYPRLAVNYFCKKFHHRCELQNIGGHMQLFIVIAPLFRYTVFSWEKKPFCKVLFLIFSKTQTTHNGTRKIFHFVGREILWWIKILSKWTLIIIQWASNFAKCKCECNITHFTKQWLTSVWSL